MNQLEFMTRIATIDKHAARKMGTLKGGASP